MRKIIFTLCTLLAAIVPNAQANAASSDWQNLGGGKARVLATKDPVTSKINGVIEIQLDEGWKTYWRSPGEAGIPPEFDFSASNFVELTDVHFPTPKVIKIPDTYFMGYQGNVRFTFEADSFSDNASLNINMLAGVCEEICIPATANFQVSAQELNVSDPLATSIWDLAQLKLPASTSDEFHINSAKLMDGNVLVVSATMPSKTNQATFLLEGPNGWFSGPIVNESGIFTLELGNDFSAKANWYEKYRYTILYGESAITDRFSKSDFLN